MTKRRNLVSTGFHSINQTNIRSKMMLPFKKKSGFFFRNGKTFYGLELPLGFDYGGPLFYTHYSWYAKSYLAIDQGPIIVMIENYRSGLLWKLFMGIPDIRAGLKKLDFKIPDIPE